MQINENQILAILDVTKTKETGVENVSFVASILLLLTFADGKSAEFLYDLLYMNGRVCDMEAFLF